MFETTDVFIAPYLPEEAKEKFREWQLKGKIAFQKVVPQRKDADCKNCQDIGYIYVSFARAGPFKAPVRTSGDWVISYFDGDESAGKGWYIVRTQAFLCPACAGRPHDNLELEDDQQQMIEWWK